MVVAGFIALIICVFVLGWLCSNGWANYKQAKADEKTLRQKSSGRWID